MGPVVTINSATLVNKGLEVIEAHLLFGFDYSQISTVVHPQSIVHSMVEFTDGSTIAQASPPDMRMPISLALAWPDRMETCAVPLDLTRIGQLDFEAPDIERFPALRIARDALEAGGSSAAVMNATESPPDL